MRIIKQFLIALQFLTIIPIHIKGPVTSTNFTESLRYFPIVGMIIGAILVVTMHVGMFLSPMTAVVITLILSVFITGGIHLDGFADTCDGFYGKRSKQEILAIMKDSCIGVMGASGIVLLLLLKFSLIISLEQDIVLKVLFLSITFSRWIQVLACFVSKYAREQGKGMLFIGHARCIDVVAGALIVLTLFWLLLQVKGIYIFFAGLLCSIVFIQYAKSKIDGMTGDAIGATSEIAEVSILFFSLATISFHEIL